MKNLKTNKFFFGTLATFLLFCLFLLFFFRIVQVEANAREGGKQIAIAGQLQIADEIVGQYYIVNQQQHLASNKLIAQYDIENEQQGLIGDKLNGLSELRTEPVELLKPELQLLQASVKRVGGSEVNYGPISLLKLDEPLGDNALLNHKVLYSDRRLLEAQILDAELLYLDQELVDGSSLIKV